LFNEVEDKMDLLGIEKRWMGEEPVSDLEWDIKGYFALGGGIHDAAIACWSAKGYYDYTRPIMAIRWMGSKGQSTDPNLPHYHPAGLPLIPGYIELVEEGDSLVGDTLQHLHKIKIFSWKGPIAATGQDGAGWLLAENWWTYQTANFVTPPFAGYYSGHSTYSRTGAEIMTLITGDEYFPGGMAEYAATQDEYLLADDGPSITVKLQWATYRDASDQCSVSRIYGGLHPPQDDIPGRQVGLIVGPQAVNKANEFIHANPPQVAVAYSAAAVSDIHVGSLWYADVLFDKSMDTLVTPQLILLNNEAANTLTFNTGYWLNDITYRATYTVVDLNVTLNAVTISIQQAMDTEGIINVPSVGAPFTIDTQNPTGLATVVGAESVLNELSVSTNAEVDLFIEFNEVMNQDIAPLITVLGIDANAGLSLSPLSDWTGPSTYRALFTLTDTDAEILAADIEVSGALDVAGNEQLITMLNDVISIDTRAPQGLVATSLNIVTDADAGSTLTVTVTCDSPMNTAGTPILAFNGVNQAENLQLTGSQWLDSITHEFSFTILDGNIQTNAQIVIAGSTDENGNLLNTTTNNDVLEIDTQNPTLASVLPSVTLFSDDDVAGGLTVDLVFSEDMNTMLSPQVTFTADNPLSATLAESPGESSWVSGNTYRLAYSAADAGEELDAINILVAGVTDANGNNQSTDLATSNIFRIDTRNPVVLNMTPSSNAVTTSNVGADTFSIDIEFDEEMDESSEPAVSFSSTPAVNFIANNGSQWNTATNYSAAFDIPNETLQIPTVDISLAFGAVDLAGNSAQVFTVSNAFSVDVVNSIMETGTSIWSMYPNPAQPGSILTISNSLRNIEKIEVLDVLGKVIYVSGQIQQPTYMVTIPSWSVGLYYVRITSNGTIENQPLIISPLR
jgi:hypothetical protein